jgi:hypothetical protein
MINPFCAITIDPTLSEEHEPLTSREEWIRANTRLLREMGSEAWLRTLLDVLEGNYPNSESKGGSSPTPLPRSRQERRRFQREQEKKG